MDTTSDYVLSYDIYDWGTGHGATVVMTVHNNSKEPVNGWTLSWTFPNNQTIMSSWGATYTQIGKHVDAVNPFYWNKVIPVGGWITLGFTLSYNGANSKPTDFHLNGEPCQVL